MGAYADRVKAQNAHMSPSEMRSMICGRTKARNAERKTQNIARAAEMKAVRDTLTPQQQLKLLDERLGKGVGAIKERARLAQMILNPVKIETVVKEIVPVVVKTEAEVVAEKTEAKAVKKAAKKERKKAAAK